MVFVSQKTHKRYQQLNADAGVNIRAVFVAEGAEGFSPLQEMDAPPPGTTSPKSVCGAVSPPTNYFAVCAYFIFIQMLSRVVCTWRHMLKNNSYFRHWRLGILQMERVDWGRFWDFSKSAGCGGGGSENESPSEIEGQSPGKRSGHSGSGDLIHPDAAEYAKLVHDL